MIVTPAPKSKRPTLNCATLEAVEVTTMADDSEEGPDEHRDSPSELVRDGRSDRRGDDLTDGVHACDERDFGTGDSGMEGRLEVWHGKDTGEE